MLSDRLAGLLLACAYAVLWAGTGIVLRVLADRLDTSIVVFVRCAIGALALLPVALLIGADQYALITPERLVYLIGSVMMVSVIGGMLNVYSLKTLGMSRAFPINNSGPLFTLLFGFLFLRETLDARMVTGALLVFGGVCLISRPRRSVRVHGDMPDAARDPQPRGRVLAAGLAASAATAMMYGLSPIVLAKGLQGINSIVANSVRLSAAAAAGLVIAGARGKLPTLRQIDASTIWLLLLVGTVGYAGVSTLYVAAVQLAGPSLVSVISSTSPVYALPMSIIFLRERPTRATLAGTTLAVAGIILIVL